jgi:hypothetical protein
MKPSVNCSQFFLTGLQGLKENVKKIEGFEDRNYLSSEIVTYFKYTGNFHMAEKN